MSVFTLDLDKRRVSSPWTRSPQSKMAAGADGSGAGQIAKLDPEPQHGPTEYKLHLLLRPRRAYRSMTTAMGTAAASGRRMVPQSLPKAPSPVASVQMSSQTRHERLLNLTTQLMWRLQQSSPFHVASDMADLVIPQLPDPANDELPQTPVMGTLHPAIEASRGALYEIGVMDDGTLAGLTRDEMDESLATLRSMAASLGCCVDVLRSVIVGQCEWAEDAHDLQGTAESSSSVSTTEDEGEVERLYQADLLVVEALVRPPSATAGDKIDWPDAAQFSPHQRRPTPRAALPPNRGALTRNQMRVTLTGPTTAGKSTLLATLTTGNLDNGRGTNRISLLRHRHELVSGATSSIAQEVIGYTDDDRVINYAAAGIETWINIHDRTRHGRLVLLSDSAGRPRYRRTTLRALVGWRPHWTLFCAPADAAADATSLDATTTHLRLCLDLALSLVIVITKVDLATRSGLARTLATITSIVKDYQRTLEILVPTPSAESSDLAHTSSSRENPGSLNAIIARITAQDPPDLFSVVPVVLTSAVTAIGIPFIHALLQRLPLPSSPTYSPPPQSLFHIEETFSLPASYTTVAVIDDGKDPTDQGVVVAGLLGSGTLVVGDRVLLSPLSSPSPEDDDDDTWLPAHIVSIHNLRLPVQTLDADQVGSIGLVFDGRVPPKIRKGMVLVAVSAGHANNAALSPSPPVKRARQITARFADARRAALLSPGHVVSAYVASVRATARVVEVSGGPRDWDGGADFELCLALLTRRECIELGAQILLLLGEAGQNGLSSLKGLVGRVVEIEG